MRRDPTSLDYKDNILYHTVKYKYTCHMQFNVFNKFKWILTLTLNRIGAFLRNIIGLRGRDSKSTMQRLIMCQQIWIMWVYLLTVYFSEWLQLWRTHVLLAGCLFRGLLFDLEDSGCMFLRNLGLFPNYRYTALQPGIPCTPTLT
jgi:hypothetical protein